MILTEKFPNEVVIKFGREKKLDYGPESFFTI